MGVDAFFFVLKGIFLKQIFDGEHFCTGFFIEFVFWSVFNILVLKYSVLALSLSNVFDLFFFSETIVPPSDLDNDIQGVVTIPLAGPDLVG